MKEAATILSSLSSNSTVQQISTLFTLLDINKDSAISTTEAIGSIEENFSVLDTDNNSSLNLTELQGLLALLK
jgi:Ca2+-binding EF-hand superfamily protein